MAPSVLSGIAVSVLLYLGLQFAFLLAVPERLLRHGWQGVSFDSPFGQLALLLNLHWLAALLYADAVVSPGGSAYVGVAIDARHTYALGKNGLLPRWVMPVAFVVSGEFVSWSGWHDLRLALPLVLAGLPLFLVLRRDSTTAPLPAELRDGAWLVVYLAGLTLLSWLGGFKGSGHLPQPWDSVAVAVFSLAVFAWAVASGVRQLRSTETA